MEKKNLIQEDPEIAELIKAELHRRQVGLEMIPSENHTSLAVLEALGSILTDKYSEGYPGKRYYAGNQIIDKVESLAQERAKHAFLVPHANVQPLSGAPANTAVYLAVAEPGDVIMGQNLADGGHLTHGAKGTFSARFYKSVPYFVEQDGSIDFKKVRQTAKEHKPRLMWVGASAYTKLFPFKEMAEIADEVGAYLVADIAHVAGLVLAGAHPSPAPFVHIITTTTHKTLRGPRGAIIMVTQKGLDKDPELAKKVDKAVFPSGIQAGPHNHQTAAIAVALKEAMSMEFKEYGYQVVKNAKALAQGLMDNGLTLVSGGTENHMVLVDLTPFGKGTGVFAQDALDAAGITINKNTIPKDPSSPFYPSGIRLGTPAITTRGMKEEEMKDIGAWVARVIEEVKHYQLPGTKEERIAYLRQFKKDIAENQKLKDIKQEVAELCSKFPLPY
jgi:glycine hydroxymethyltransferase